MEHQKGSEVREADYPIDNLFLNRWSSRAMSGEKISEKELFTLFEAARWAPSSFNEQPWAFIYAMRGTKEWENFFEVLGEFNQSWCKDAGALICLISSKSFSGSGEPNWNNMSDAGAAWENLALQGSLTGLVVHGMAGFDKEKARKNLKVPEEYEIVHMIAVGKKGDISNLPENIRENEKPNKRKPIKEFVFKGQFSENGDL